MNEVIEGMTWERDEYIFLEGDAIAEKVENGLSDYREKSGSLFFMRMLLGVTDVSAKHLHKVFRV